MKNLVDIQRQPKLLSQKSRNQNQIEQRRAIIDHLNRTRRERLEHVRKQLQDRQLEPCIDEDQIYVEGHSIEKPKSKSNSRIKVKEQFKPILIGEKNPGVGDIDKMTFDKKFKNYLNHKQQFLDQAKIRQERIRQKRRIANNDVQDYYNEEEILSNTGADYQYKDADDMNQAYQIIATGKRRKKGGVQLFYAEKFQFAFRLVQFESLLQLMQNPSQALITKDLLLNYLFDQPMIMMLYSINPYLLGDQIAQYSTQIASMLSFEEFSNFLLIDRQPTYFEYTQQNLQQARKIGRGLKCAPIVGKWIDQTGIYQDLMDLFTSVDMFGDNKAQRDVLAKKLTLYCEKQRIMDLYVVQVVNINKLIPLNRLIYQIEHEVGGGQKIQRKQFQQFLQQYHRLQTPDKDKVITKLIMAGKYDTSYIYIVSGQVLQFLKEVFSQMQKYAEYFVPKQKYLEKLSKHKKYPKLKDYLVRTQNNRYVNKETVGQALERFSRQADSFVDIQQVLDFFTSRGRPRVVEYQVYLANLEKQLKVLEMQEQQKMKKFEETGEEPTSSSDEEFEKELKKRKISRKLQKLAEIRKSLKYDINKKFNVTIPVGFAFDARDKQKKVSIRQKKLKQMLDDKRLQQEKARKPIQIKQVPKYVKEPLYQKMLKDQQRQRKQRLERFRLQIQNSMVQMPERLIKKHEPTIHCDFGRQGYQFVARPMPWYCEVNLLDRINKQKQERREKILQQIINRHHDNDLPEGVLRMLERHEQIDKKRMEKRTASTGSVGQCTFIPTISQGVPDFKAIHEKLEMDMQIAKENKQPVYPQPFSFDKEHKSKSHMSHQNCVPTFQQRTGHSKSFNYKVEAQEVKTTEKFKSLVQKRKKDRQMRKKMEQDEDQKKQIRKMRQQKFAPQVRRVLQKNQSQLGRSRQQMLSRIKQFQRQQKKKVRDYQNKMIEIYTKVWNRPLLIQSNQYGENDVKKNPRLTDLEAEGSFLEQKGEAIKQSDLRQKGSKRRKIDQNYEQKRKKAIQQAPGQYLIQNDANEIQGRNRSQGQAYSENEAYFDQGQFDQEDYQDEIS